jgi:hypothetical protein
MGVQAIPSGIYGSLPKDTVELTLGRSIMTEVYRFSQV